MVEGTRTVVICAELFQVFDQILKAKQRVVIRLVEISRVTLVGMGKIDQSDVQEVSRLSDWTAGVSLVDDEEGSGEKLEEFLSLHPVGEVVESLDDWTNDVRPVTLFTHEELPQSCVKAKENSWCNHIQRKTMINELFLYSAYIYDCLWCIV